MTAYAIPGVRTLDGATRDLFVQDGHFCASVPERAERLDSAGLYALPGLADSHAHLGGNETRSLLGADEPAARYLARARENLGEQLDAGVLLVHHKGGGTRAVLDLLADSEHSRPHLALAGRILTAPGTYYAGLAEEVSPEEVAGASARQAERPATWVKIIGDWPVKGRGPAPSFTEAQLRTAVDAAHAAGARVAIHAAAPSTPSLAVAAGVDSIEHGLFLTEADVRALGARGGAWVPTLVGMEKIAAFLGRDSSGGRLFGEGLANVRDLLPVAVAAGVSILAGTDLAIAHGAVAEEALRLAAYGLDAEHAVAAVSSAAYGYLGVHAGFDPGMSADLVLFDGDPRDHLEVLRSPRVVLRHGRRVR